MGNLLNSTEALSELFLTVMLVNLQLNQHFLKKDYLNSTVLNNFQKFHTHEFIYSHINAFYFLYPYIAPSLFPFPMMFIFYICQSASFLFDSLVCFCLLVFKIPHISDTVQYLSLSSLFHIA